MISPKTQPISRTQTESGPDAAMAEAHIRGLLAHIGEDPDREGLLETPARVVRAMREHFAGYELDPELFLQRTFEEVEGYDQLVLVSDIALHSHCEHHMVPFVGTCHVAYLPDQRVVGLSKIARVVDAFASRLQIQEKLTQQIANCIDSVLSPLGVAVIIKAQHFCMCHRGVRKPGAWTTTSALKGTFKEDAVARQELLSLIDLRS